MTGKHVFFSSSSSSTSSKKLSGAASRKTSRLQKRGAKVIKTSKGSTSSSQDSLDVGLIVLKGSQTFYVSSIAPGSAADQAGLQLGDEIFKINGLDAYNRYSDTDIMNALNGPEGTSVTLEIARQKDGGILTLKLLRVKPVEKTEYDVRNTDGILIVAVRAMNATTATSLQNDLQKVNWSTVRGVLLDLRVPPHGSLTGMGPILSAFLPKGTPYARIIRKNGPWDNLGTGSQPIVPANIPLFVALKQNAFGDLASLSAHALFNKRKAVVLVEEGGTGKTEITAGLSFDELPADTQAYCADNWEQAFWLIRSQAVTVAPIPGQDATLAKVKYMIEFGKTW